MQLSLIWPSIHHYCLRHGVSATLLMQTLGLTPAMTQDSTLFLNDAYLEKLLYQLKQLDSSDDLAFKMGQNVKPELMGLLGSLVLTSSNIEEILAVFAHLSALLGQHVQLALHRTALESHLRYISTPPSTLLVFFTEQLFMSIYTVARQLITSNITPLRIEFCYPEPAHAHVYHQFFACPCIFNQTFSSIIYPQAAIHLPLSAAQPEEYQLLLAQTQQLLPRNQHVITTENIVALLEQMLQQQQSGLTVLAKQLNMSSRTLQRKLTQLGLNYRELWRDVRMQAACQKLQHSTLTISDISDSLLFENKSNFINAFVAWSGKTPSIWRLEQLKLI